MPIFRAFLRTSLTASLLAVAACGEAPAPTPAEIAEQRDDVDLIECALGEGSRFGADCSVERVAGAPLELIVRHPSGAFRRLEIASDKSGLTAADGADVAVNALDRETLEVRIAQDRYRFPARLTGPDDGGA